MGWLNFMAARRRCSISTAFYAKRRLPRNSAAASSWWKLGPGYGRSLYRPLAGGHRHVAADDPGSDRFDLDLYLQMLSNFIPAPPEHAL